MKKLKLENRCLELLSVVSTFCATLSVEVQPGISKQNYGRTRQRWFHKASGEYLDDMKGKGERCVGRLTDCF